MQAPAPGENEFPVGAVLTLPGFACEYEERKEITSHQVQDE